MAFTEKYVTNSGAGTADGSSLANAWSWATMLTSLSAGQRANVQGAITRTTPSDAFTNAGTAANPMAIRGINSTLGDLEANGRTRGGALVTTNFPVITYTTGNITLPAFSTCEHLSITSASSSLVCVIASGGSGIVVRRCVISNTHATFNNSALRMTASGIAIDCDLSTTSSNSSSVGFQSISAGAMIVGCLITGGSGSGCIGGSNVIAIIGCTLRDAGFGITLSTSTAIVIGNSFRNITNVYVKATASQRLFQNNVAWGVGGSSQWYQSAGTVVENNQLNNFVGNMGVADADLGNWINSNGVTLTADPFVSSTDLTLNTTSGGGALVRAAGYPAYLDGGAWQHQDAGGGGMIGGGNLNGGFQ
jgi:hypothetical protein